MHTAIAELEQAQVRSDIPDFRPGDTLKVHVKVTEGNRSRIQVFQGVVIRRLAGTGDGLDKRDRQVIAEAGFPVDGESMAL